MRRETVEGAVFLSPVFWDYPQFKWSGKELTIVPPQELRPNTTYILTFGADAADANGNKMGKSITFAYSTGPAIDSGAISGTVFYESKQRIYYDIWAYSLGDTETEFITRIPDYATQIDSAGNFALEHLGLGRYLVISIEDKNDDLFWDPSVEAIGLPPAIFRFSGQNAIDRVAFRPARRDTATAYISGIDPINNQRISVSFSQQPDSSSMLDPGSYVIRIMDTDSILEMGMVYVGEEKKLMIETGPMADGKTFVLFPKGLVTAWGIPFDTSGGRFDGTATPDTEGPRMLSTFPPPGSSSIYQDSVVEMTFSERLQVLQFAEAVTVIVDSSDTLGFTVFWPNPNVARLRFPSRLPRETPIAVTISPSRVYDIFRNPMADSVINFTFRLPPADTVGSVKARIASGGEGRRYFGMLVPMDRGDSYIKSFDNNGVWFVESVMPGAYRFEFFDDLNADSEWYVGSIIPFRPAEPFSFLADTVRVRSRWETEIGDIDLPRLGD
jgi:hypothetical protein